MSALAGLALMIAPIAILSLSEGLDAKRGLVLLSSSITLFSGFLTLLTSARTCEVVEITAVYV